MKAAVTLFLAVLAGLWSGPNLASAASPTLERLEEVEKKLAGLETVSGRFTLEKNLEHLAEPLTAQGRFFFARPDFLRWEQQTPDWSLLEMEGDRLDLWAGSSAQPVRQPEARAQSARPVVREIMAWLKFDSRALAAVYDVAVLRAEPLTLRAQPRRAGARKYLQAIEVEFGADQRVVRRVVISEAAGRTSLTFDQVLLNPPRPGPGYGRPDH